MTLYSLIECDGCQQEMIEAESDLTLINVASSTGWTISATGRTHLCSSCSADKRPLKVMTR